MIAAGWRRFLLAALILLLAVGGYFAWRHRQGATEDYPTAKAARGRGVARALIEAVYARADAAGVPSVYWLTAEDNYPGRMLYDRVAVRSPFIRYNRPT